MLFKVGSVLASYGESVPVNLKIKMAQQEFDLKQNENKLAWDNYYKSVQQSRAELQQHARAAQQGFLTMWPNIKAQVSSILDPAKRKELSQHWATISESLAPGTTRPTRRCLVRIRASRRLLCHDEVLQ
jgi:hypothetical protein